MILLAFSYTQDGLTAAMNATRLTSRMSHAYEACFRFSLVTLKDNILISNRRVRVNSSTRQIFPETGKRAGFDQRAEWKHFRTVRRQSKQFLTFRIFSAIS